MSDSQKQFVTGGVIVVIIAVIVIFSLMAYSANRRNTDNLGPNDQAPGSEISTTTDTTIPEASSTNPGTATTSTSTQATSTLNTITYQRNDYGFSLVLPQSWQGYRILDQVWNGQSVSDPRQKYQGPQIVIRHPLWTSARPYQDIPVMIFTPEQWRLIQQEDLAVSAAPIGPSKLGENSRYVFALPARWVGFTGALNQTEALEITKSFRAY